MRLLRYNFHTPYLLPIVSALVLVLTLPPFNFWPLVFVALIPLYIFTFTETRLSYVFFGGIFFGLIYSSYISLVTLSSFTWLPEAHLFVNAVKLLSPIIAFVMAVTTALVWIFAVSLKQYTQNPVERALLFGLFALVEWILGKMLFGFNYGSIAYAAGHFEVVRLAGSIGGAFLITFLVVVINAALAQAILSFTQKEKSVRVELSFMSLFVVCVLIGALALSKGFLIPRDDTHSFSVAIIQNDAREESEAFGRVEDGRFAFPALETQLREIAETQSDVIIYPFSPWVGVLSDTINNSAFDREVIAIDFDTFGAWLREHVPSESVFVTWNTRLSDGDFLNELNYWKDGVLVDSYAKVKLFPFLDYTPMWSQDLGLYTTPYDATGGDNTAPLDIGGIAVGQLICSEVIGPASAHENSVGSNVLFSVGSEAMFSSSIASEINLQNARLRAVETGRPVVRANKFGPSAIIDRYGNIVNRLAFDETGILSGNVTTTNKEVKTIYERTSEYPFIIVLIGYTLFLRLRDTQRTKRDR